MFLLPLFAFSQEEDLGPNGGQLKFAGEFYTEVVSNKDGSFDVYLLDKETKKPTIRYSYVTGFFESAGGSKVEILCVGQKTYFECYPRGWNLKKGKKLILSLSRDNVTGNDVTYNLPIYNPKALSSVQGRMSGSIKFDRAEKLMSFRNGKHGYATSAQLAEGGSYCVIENLKLQKLTIKPKKKFTTKIEKVEIADKTTHRYSVIRNKEYNLICDFTAEADFKKPMVIERINQHLSGWITLK
jgi:hypothetical protein